MPNSKRLLPCLLLVAFAAACSGNPARIADPNEFPGWPAPEIRSLPRLPERALRGQIRGFVSADFQVDSTGRVVSIEIVDSSPGVYDTPVRLEMRKWKYKPLESSPELVVSAPQRVHFDFCLTDCPGDTPFPDGEEVFLIRAQQAP